MSRFHYIVDISKDYGLPSWKFNSPDFLPFKNKFIFNFLDDITESELDSLANRKTVELEIFEVFPDGITNRKFELKSEDFYIDYVKFSLVFNKYEIKKKL